MKQNGFLEVRSEPGVGTEVCVNLPMEEAISCSIRDFYLTPDEKNK